MPIREIYSFSSIVSRMTQKMSSSTGVSDFTPGSIIKTSFECVAVFIEYLQFLIEQAFRSFYTDTATDEDLDKRVQDLNMSRNAAVAASGVLTFYSSTPATGTFVIYSGTTVTTQPDVFGNTISYTLDDDVTFVSGALSATGNVTCSIYGVFGNVASGKITNIPTTISGIDSVTNLSAFTNGATEESDDQLRKRIPIHMNGLQQGNEYAISDAVLSIDGITLVRLAENNPLPGDVTVYVSNETGVLTQDQIDDVLAAAEAAASFGISVNVVTPDVEYITIQLDADIDDVNYDVNFIKEDIRDFIDERVRTNPDSDLFLYDIILASTIQGVNNVKNVKINNIASDYTVSGFKVIRINDSSVDITINLI